MAIEYPMTLTVRKPSEWQPVLTSLVKESLRLAAVPGSEFRKFSSWVRLTADRMEHGELECLVGCAGSEPVALAGYGRHSDVVRVAYLYVSPAAGAGTSTAFLSLAEKEWRPVRRIVVLGGPQTFLDDLIGSDGFLTNGYTRFERARFERGLGTWEGHGGRSGVEPMPDADKASLIRLQREGYAGSIDQLLIEDPERMVTELLEDPWFSRDDSFVVRSERDVLGALYTLRKGRSAWVASLCVHPDARGQGLGRRLMLHAMDAYRAANYDRAGLIVTLSNGPAVRLYQELGFVCSRRHTLVYVKHVARHDAS